jgi:hypothetical protein
MEYKSWLALGLGGSYAGRIVKVLQASIRQNEWRAKPTRQSRGEEDHATWPCEHAAFNSMDGWMDGRMVDCFATFLIPSRG